MARRRSGSAIAERLEQFLAAQERIAADFERSLRNARHFIDLAGVALEREPDHTEAMLEQVLEIDLLRHVSEQFESFQSVAALLSAAQGPVEAAPDEGPLRDLRRRYEAMVQEAELQSDRIDTLLTTLRVTH